jgi:hypothetical protein
MMMLLMYHVMPKRLPIRSDFYFILGTGCLHRSMVSSSVLYDVALVVLQGGNLLLCEGVKDNPTDICVMQIRHIYHILHVVTILCINLMYCIRARVLCMNTMIHHATLEA